MQLFRLLFTMLCGIFFHYFCITLEILSCFPFSSLFNISCPCVTIFFRLRFNLIDIPYISPSVLPHYIFNFYPRFDFTVVRYLQPISLFLLPVNAQTYKYTCGSSPSIFYFPHFKASSFYFIMYFFVNQNLFLACDFHQWEDTTMFQIDYSWFTHFFLIVLLHYFSQMFKCDWYLKFPACLILKCNESYYKIKIQH